MQRYNCTICHEDSFGGRSVVHEGMFFKVCCNCAEDELLYEELERSLLEMNDAEECGSAKLGVEQDNSKNVPLGENLAVGENK